MLPIAQSDKTLFLYNPRNKLHKSVIQDLLSLTQFNLKEKCKDSADADELIDMWEVGAGMFFSSEKIKKDFNQENEDIVDLEKKPVHQENKKYNKKTAITGNKPLINQLIYIYHKNATFKLLIKNLVPIFAIFSTANCEKESNNLVISNFETEKELEDFFRFMFENSNNTDNEDGEIKEETVESKKNSVKFKDITDSNENADNSNKIIDNSKKNTTIKINIESKKEIIDLKHKNIQKVIFLSLENKILEMRVYVISSEDKKYDLKEIGPRISCEILEKWDGPIHQKK